MDLLDFFEQACAQSQPGDVVVLPLPLLAACHHADALAQRLGFDGQGLPKGQWRNGRHAQSVVIRWLQKVDFADWHALFVTCFGHGISEAQWAWKYRDTDKPGVAMFEQGQMIAFYGGMPRAVAYGGKVGAGIQIGDVMVHPAFRGSLSRKGPFQMVASTFLELSLSVSSPYWVGFGFPNQRAMQVAKRLHLYRPVDRLVELFWQPQKDDLPWWLGVVSPDPLKLNFVDHLWQEMCRGLPSSLMGVRDSGYVRARYLSHPAHQHSLLKVFNRLSRKIYGLVVLRQLSDGRQEILDVIGHSDHFVQLIQAAQAFAFQMGSPAVSAWVTESHVHWLRTPDANVQALDVQIPTNDWVPGNLDVLPDGRWWLTSGDTDFR